MKTISYKQPSAADVWQAFAAIVVCLTFLGLCFAWATDPRPVQGSEQCRYRHMYKQHPMSWSADRDCKPSLLRAWK